MIESASPPATGAAPKPLRSAVDTQPEMLPATFSTKTGLLLTLILSIFAVAPLLYPGFFQTHAGFVPLWNIVDLRANLGNLSWMPHLATTFDPLRSAGLLPWYLAALLPFTPTIAVKLVMAAGWLAGGLGMFLWLKSWVGNGGALVAALVYVYLPFQIVAVYVRGAWGEALFWGLLPWAILAATYLVTSPKIVLVPVAAFFWLLLGLSQLGLTIWAVIFIVALLLTVHRVEALLPILSAALGTALAAGIYLILAPQFLAVPSHIYFFDHFLYPFQLVSAHWDFGVSRPGWEDGHSLQLGLAALGLSIISVALWQRGSSNRATPVSRTDRRLIFFLAAAVVLVLLQFGAAAFLWKLPLLSNTLSYPWQLLGFAGLCLAILAGAALWIEPQFTRLPLLASVVIVVILSVYPWLLPQFIPVTPATAISPLAELGEKQLALLNHNFTVRTSGHTVGLDRTEAAIPLEAIAPLQPGNTLILNVVWQPLKPFDNNLKVFAHLVDQNETVLAQFDGQPQEGNYPTSRWLPGEIIRDAYPINLPADAPPGPYRLFIGLYNETTFERLPVPTDTNGRVILNVQ